MTHLGSLHSILILVVILDGLLPLPKRNLPTHFANGEHIIRLRETVEPDNDGSSVLLWSSAVGVTVTL